MPCTASTTGTPSVPGGGPATPTCNLPPATGTSRALRNGSRLEALLTEILFVFPACGTSSFEKDPGLRQLCQLRGQCPKGPAPVGDGVLLQREELGEGPPVPLGGDQDGVVAESAAAPDLGGDDPVHRSGHGYLGAVGPPHEGRRLEAGGALLGGDAVEFLQELGHVVGVGGALAGEAGRPDAGGAAE